MRRAFLALFLILAAGADVDTIYAADRRPRSVVSAVPSSAPVRSMSQHANGELFFEIDDTVPPANDRAARPRRVRVYWDHAASRSDDDLTAERDLLLRYLDSVHPGIIDLVLLSASGPELKIIEAPDEAEQVVRVLGAVPYEGAWSSHDLDLPLPPADACLYFSDGVARIDPADVGRIRCPLYVLSSAEDANRGLLRVLARRSAGAYFDLTATSSDQAVARMTRGPRVIGVTSTDGRDVAFALLPSSAGRFRIVGPVPKSGDIIVTLAGGSKRTLTRTYSISGVGMRQSDGIGVLWAMDRLYELCAAQDPDAERINALARRYSVDAAIVAE
jgi:hypothetical protein